MKLVPSALAALAVAAPLALAGLPGPAVLTLGISGAGAPRAGHSYTYLVSVDDPARAPAWLVHLAISAPARTTVVAAGGGAGGCRAGPGGAACVWPQLAGGSAVRVSVTVRLESGLRAGTPLAATARLSYDWGQLSDSATSVRTVAGPPPRPKVKPKPPRLKPPRPKPPRPKPEPRPAGTRHTPPSRPSPGAPPSLVRPHRAVTPSRTPQLRPSRPPSPGALFPWAGSELITPPPRRPVPGLPIDLLLVVILTPCVAAVVTRFARGR